MDADVHAICNLGVLFLRRFRVGLDRDLICGDELAVGVHGDSVSGNLEVCHVGEAMCNSFFGLFKSLDLAALAANLLQVVEVALADGCDIATAEDTDFKVLRLLLAVFTGDLRACPLEVVQGLVDNALGADVAGDGCGVPVVGDQFVRGRQVDTVDMGVPGELLASESPFCRLRNLRDLRGTAGQVDLLGASFPSHADDLPAGGASHDTVIHKQDVAVLEFGLHGIKLAPDTLLPSLLLWHDERAEDIAILDKAVADGFVQVSSDVGGRGGRGLRDGNHDVNVLDDFRTQHVKNARTQTVTHTLTTAVHTDTVDH